MRRDIQFLRGVAVLVVVFYHAGISGFKNGYLGVDIFFVISGFLITSIILRDLEGNRFSFNRFYMRRGKRLLPAVYCTLIFTSGLSYLFLTNSQWNDYLWQLTGSVTFTANMVLPFQVGYFDGAAEGKPLLHVWSLSLEEQYYLTLPLLLFLTSSKYRGKLLFAGFLLSALLCVVLVTFPYQYWRLPETYSDEWAFYLFPTRAWELLSGSIAAWWMLRRPEFAVPGLWKPAAMMVVFVLIPFSLDDVHPRADALLVVLATVVLVVGRDDWLPNARVINAIEKVGDWSYSLYLVHWPLFAFAYVGSLGQVPVLVKPLLVFTAFCLAWAQYRYVEQPFRYGWQRNAKVTWAWLAVATLLVFAIPLPAFITAHTPGDSRSQDFDKIRRPNYGLSERCDQDRSNFQVATVCRTSDQPRIAVWGDSIAMHLVPGLRAVPGVGDSLVQLTTSNCAPILDLAQIGARESWAQYCVAFNNKAIEYLRQSESVEHVILSAAFDDYFKVDAEMFVNGEITRSINPSLIIERIIETISAVRLAGKNPIIVSPPPTTGFDVGECLERKAMNLVVFDRQDCTIEYNDYRNINAAVIAALTEIEHSTGVKVLWLDELMCRNSRCATEVGGILLYRDKEHLSVDGSKHVIGLLDIKQYVGN